MNLRLWQKSFETWIWAYDRRVMHKLKFTFQNPECRERKFTFKKTCHKLKFTFETSFVMSSNSHFKPLLSEAQNHILKNLPVLSSNSLSKLLYKLKFTFQTSLIRSSNSHLKTSNLKLIFQTSLVISSNAHFKTRLS